MPAPFKNIAVVGATGNLGPHIISALLSHHFAVTVLTRPTSTSTPNFPPAVRVFRGNYDDPVFLASAFKGIDVVILTVGVEFIPRQGILVEAGAKAGVRRVVPSEFGSDITNPIAVNAVPFYKKKADVAEQIKRLAAVYPTLTWTTFICGPFYDWCLKLGFYGFDLQNKRATLYDRGLARFDTTTLSTVGAAVVSVLSTPEKYANEYVFINSLTTSQAEMLAALKKVSGTDNWSVEERSAQEYKDGGREKDNRGDIMGTYDLIFATTFQEGNGADFSRGRLANEELGLGREEVEGVTIDVWNTDRHVVKW
ncbi:hypothetical protein ACLMJK_007269 [Lecanora helva]